MDLEIDEEFSSDFAIVADEVFASGERRVRVDTAMTMLLGGRTTKLALDSLLGILSRLIGLIHPEDQDVVGEEMAKRIGQVVFNSVFTQTGHEKLGVALLVTVYNDGIIGDLKEEYQSILEATEPVVVVVNLAMLSLGVARMVSAYSGVEPVGEVIRKL